MKVVKKYVYEIEGDCGIIGFSELVGEKEKQGIFGKFFHDAVFDDKMGEKTFEKGERRMLQRVCDYALKNANVSSKDINVFLGGTLKQNILYHNDENHFIKFKNKYILVNSFHHQSIDKLAPNLLVVAKSLDDEIEIIKHKFLKIIGLQFHPELFNFNLKNLLNEI